MLAVLASTAAAGCTQSEYCADVGINATVTDVLHDTLADQVHVSLRHSLSYCTGTDEKRYSMEHLVIDMATGEVTVAQRSTDEPVPFGMPDACCPLYRDGNFNNDSCPGCELVLRSGEGRDTFHFTTALPGADEAMLLEVSRDDVPLVRVEIGGFVSRAL